MSAQPVSELKLQEATAPPERRGIARDAVRMLVTDRKDAMHLHKHFYDLPQFIKPGDVVVVNDSATIPAALRARRENGEVLTLHISTMIDPQLWIVEPRGTVHAGEKLLLDEGGIATIIAPTYAHSPRLWYAQFHLPLPMHAFLAKAGEPIRYSYMKMRFPLSDYQTIFARKPGSAEMPSAARPFTERTVREIRRAGAKIAYITLHCGVSSFETPERPALERFFISPGTAELVNGARANGSRIIAVGTTVVRALESAVSGNKLTAASGWTDLIIEPSHQLRIVDALITGFHEPQATHISMLGAFLSNDVLAQAYDEAIEHAYYCHEFGDIHAIF